MRNNDYAAAVYECDVETLKLKAELARYMELGTPDEFARALASSKDGAYPKLLRDHPMRHPDNDRYAGD